MKCATPKCPGDPSAPGGARGMCPRCYKRHQRGQEPTAKTARPGDRTAQLPPVRVSPEEYARAVSAAQAVGVRLAEWIRRACAKAAK